MKYAKCGYGADQDMLLYFKMSYLSSTLENRLRNQGLNTPGSMLSLGSPAIITQTANANLMYGFPQNAPSANPYGLNFSGGSQMYYVNKSNVYGSYLRPASGSPTTVKPWTVAVWYAFPTHSAVTQTLLEFSAEQNGTSAKNLAFHLRYLSGSSKFAYVTAASDGGGYFECLSPVMPRNGHLAVSNSTVLGMALEWYSNGALLGVTPFTTAIAPDTQAGTSSSCGWWIGNSRHFSSSSVAGADYCLVGQMAELAVWRTYLGANGVRRIYGDSVQPWDDNELYRTNPNTQVRVFIEDQSTGGNTWFNMSDYRGGNFLKSVTIKHDVESDSSADIVLHRRVHSMTSAGSDGFLDLSPLAQDVTMLPYAAFGPVQLRRKVRIEKAVVPHMWRIQGWEWRAAFEGYIDSWKSDVDSVQLTCVDKNAPLKDTYLFEDKQYFYSSTGMEVVQQQYINENVPKIRQKTTGITSVAYRGYEDGSLPTIYTDCGNSFTPYFEPTNFAMIHNERKEGTAWDAIKALSDQIGAICKYKYHSPTDAYRLITYLPPRDQLLIHDYIYDTTTANMLCETRHPHGMAVGATVRFQGATGTATPYNGYHSVASVDSPYRMWLSPVAGKSTLVATAYTRSSGSLRFTSNIRLNPEQILGISAIEAKADDIRNYAVVRYNRSPISLASVGITVATVDSNKYLSIKLGQQLPNIDPDNLGFQFEIQACVGSTASLIGAYMGFQTGVDVITTMASVPWLTANTSYTTGFGYFDSQYVSFQEATAANTNSISKYGMRPVAYYEAGNGAISTAADAYRLASYMVSDLNEPNADFSMDSRVFPLDINDMVTIPADPKGRWSSAIDGTITAITETYDKEGSRAQYALRLAPPTRGMESWARLAADAPGAQRPVTRFNISGATASAAASATWQTVSPSKGLVERIGFDRGFQTTKYGKLTSKAKRTVVYGTTRGATAVPMRSEILGIFNADTPITLSQIGNTKLSTATNYSIRYAEMDEWGNIGPISGLGVASAAFSSAPTYKPQSSAVNPRAVLVSNVTTTTAPFGGGVLPTQTDTSIWVANGADRFAISQNPDGLWVPNGTYTAASDNFFYAAKRGFYKISFAGYGYVDNVGNAALMYANVYDTMTVSTFRSLGHAISQNIDSTGTSGGAGAQVSSISLERSFFCNSGNKFKIYLQSNQLFATTWFWQHGSYNTNTPFYGIITAELVSEV